MMNKNEKIKEVTKKFNELFKLCEEYNIDVILEGDALRGDKLEEAIQDEDRIFIW